MRRETVVICILAGMLMGLGAVWYRDRKEMTAVPMVVTGQTATPPSTPWQGRAVWSDPPPDESVIANYHLVIEAQEGDFSRIRHDTPMLFIEDEDGGRVPVQTYYSTDAAHLHLTDVNGLRRAWYTELIAWYDDGEQDLLPIDLDLRTSSGR